MLLFLCVALIAQGSVDPISGGAGWVGAGLLGAILGWLLFVHLPAKDKLVRDLIKDCDVHNDEVVKQFVAQIAQQRADFQEALRFVMGQSERHIAVLAEAFRQEFNHLREEMAKR